MNRKTSAVVTTACVGMAMGAAAYMMSGNTGNGRRAKQLKRSTGKALRQVGSFIENVSYMIR